MAELDATFAFGAPEPAPGVCRAAIAVRDRHSQKEGDFAVPFEVERAQ